MEGDKENDRFFTAGKWGWVTLTIPSDIRAATFSKVYHKGTTS